MDLTLILSIILGKLILHLTRIFKIGGGSAAPGLYALKIDPNLIQKLSSKIQKSVVITGTNGKTTTARLLAHLVQAQNLKILRNVTGSNLERGVASALVHKSNLWGQIKDVDLAIWELDEAAFNQVVNKIKPQIIVFLNAYRDQLDRYGEVDNVVNKWLETLNNLHFNPQIWVNGNDPNTLRLVQTKQLSCEIFHLNGIQARFEKAVDQISTQQKPALQATVTKDRGLAGTEIKLTFQNSEHQLLFPIPGIYHTFDLLAACAAYCSLNLPISQINSQLKNYSPAFGRVERLTVKNKDTYIFLIKNPVGASMVFETLQPIVTSKDSLILALNDNFADGRDVSWIWDAELEILTHKSPAQIICTGSRVYDLALRVKYSQGYPQSILTFTHLKMALEQALATTSGKIFILPTYTAMLELQNLLTEMKIKPAYWKEVA
ncbi:MAG: MurT ligase domain-containing protein [Patescibacteria group bacterium]|nr:MurT ligase domain-containing protein [Patescibacteria group bacterium]